MKGLDIVQNRYQEARTRHCPFEVSAGTAPRLSHLLSTQGRKEGRKRCEFKSNMDTNPRQPQVQGKNLPILLDLKREGKRGTYTLLGHKASCFSSSREVM